eukprot:2103494-Rhodomonas_salina.1
MRAVEFVPGLNHQYNCTGGHSSHSPTLAALEHGMGDAVLQAAETCSPDSDIWAKCDGAESELQVQC